MISAGFNKIQLDCSNLGVRPVAELHLLLICQYKQTSLTSVKTVKL